jgi:hypothetical protein
MTALLALFAALAAIGVIANWISRPRNGPPPLSDRAPAPELDAREDAFIITKVAGVSHANSDGTSRQSVIAGLAPGDSLILRREPNNPVDTDAVSVSTKGGAQIGYLSSERAAEMQSILKSAAIVRVRR